MQDKERRAQEGLLKMEARPSPQPLPDGDLRCGLGPWTPPWLQICSSKKTFVLAYGLVGFWYFAASAYFVATISTMEKRFKISSQTTGMIAAGEDVAFITAVLLVGYLGGRGGTNKAKWVAAGAMLMCLSYVINVIPHLLYGPGSDAMLLVEDEEDLSNVTSLPGSNQACGAPMAPEDCYEEGENSVAAFFLLLSRLVDGLGNSPYWTLGIAFLDDNVLKKKAPYYIAVVGCVRMFGPTVGFVLGSYSLSLFVDPWKTPHISNDDPRWIGAWWLGWIPCSAMVLLPGLALLLFPRVLRRAAHRLSQAQHRVVVDTNPSLQDFKKSMVRLVKNPVYMYNTVSATFMILGAMGHWYFLPKYMETQFRQSAAKASFVAGALGVGCTGLGLLTAGAVMTRFEPRARRLAAWNVFTEVVEVCTRVVFMFVGCSVWDIQGRWNPDNTWNLTTGCNAGCACDDTSGFSPVCSADQTTTFYSPCHAGCSGHALLNGTKAYMNCSCLEGEDNFVTEGACALDCTTGFYMFLLGECVIRFLSATGRAGNSLIQFRCVHPADKSVSLGLNSVLTSLFGYIPAPVIYGLVIDSTCMIWGTDCGETGNCWAYDDVMFRYLLNGSAAAFVTVGVVFDTLVWMNVKGLEVYEEDHVRLNGQLSPDMDPGVKATAEEEEKIQLQERPSPNNHTENG